VDANGRMTYSLPLELPPGVGDIVPQLGINYNHGAANGILGYGWQISGLSSITRSPGSLYHDSKIEGIDFDSTDRYDLDGMRLIETGFGEYMTWIKNFAKINGYGNIGYGPDYFVVEYLGGLKYYYGSGTTSKMLSSSNSSAVLMWGLSRIEDQSGNYIDFEYINDGNGDFRISNIKYTGNFVLSQLPQTDIVFNYETRPDKNKTWVAASLVRAEDRLANIEIKQNGVTVNKYVFTYDVKSYSRLKKIEQIRGNSILPAINIDWSREEFFYSSANYEVVETTVANTGTEATVTAGDFNADGATDFIRLRSSSISGSYGNIDLFTNVKNDDFNQTSLGTLPETQSGIGYYKDNIKPRKDRTALDFDGDGYDEIMCEYVIPENFGAKYHYKLYLQHTSGNTTPQLLFHYENYNTGNPIPKEWVEEIYSTIGDFNGDGKREVLVAIPSIMNQGKGSMYMVFIVSHNSPYITSPIPLVDGEIKTNSFVSIVPLGIIAEIYALNVLDYNGDGKDDIMALDDPNSVILGNRIYDFNQEIITSGTITFTMKLISVGNFPNGRDSRAPLYTGDFNGDGNSDVLAWAPISTMPSPGVWNLVYSKGGVDPTDVINNFYWYPTSLPASLSSVFNGFEPIAPNNFSIHIADFDGDGKDDILRLHITSSHVEYDMFYSRGDNNFEHDSGLLSIASIKAEQISVGDFNGDGAADLLCDFSIPASKPKIVYFYRNSLQRLVTSIEHDDKRIEIAYKSLAQKLDYVRQTIIGIPCCSSPIYPYVSKQSPVMVVEELLDNSLGVFNKYTYKTKVNHVLGLGALGFNEIIIESLITSKKTVNKYATDNSYFGYGYVIGGLPYLRSSVVRDANTDNLISETTIQDYRYNGAPGKNVIIQDFSSYTYDFVGGKQSGRHNVYNSSAPSSMLYDYGKPDQVVEVAGQLNDIVTTTTNFTYDLAQPWHNRGQPTVIITQTQRNSKPIYSRTKEVTYHANGKIENEKTDPSVDFKQIQYQYDGWGNVTQTDVTANNVSGTITDYIEYTVDGRFAKKKTNHLNYVEEFTHDPVWGKILTEIDIQGNTSQYEYDDVGRLTKETSPSLIESNIVYDYSQNSPHHPGLLGARYSVTKTIDQIQGETIEFYDNYGRKVRDAYPSFDGSQTIYEDIRYNARGEVVYITEPYTNNPVKTTFTYDELGRETMRVMDNGGPTFTTTYTPAPVSTYPGAPQFGLAIQVTNNATGKFKTTYTDETGEVYKIDDNGNNIVYDLNSANAPDKITSVSSNFTIDYGYDAIGRITSKTEPNVPEVKFEYDGLGRVKKQDETLIGTLTQYEYDGLNRLVQKTINGNAISYVYENAPGNGGTGQIKDVVSAYGTELHYSYDNFGRMAQFEQTALGEHFISHFEYDNHDRKTLHTYPNGDNIEYVYNDYSALELVKLNSLAGTFISQNLWKIAEKNNYGQITKADYYDANNTPLYKQINTYSPLGYHLRREVANLPMGALVSDIRYGFDLNNGNVTSRQDVSRGLFEEFEYDAFDRLTVVKNTVSNTRLQIEYSNTGNITKKTDVSNSQFPWRYDKYALTKLPQPETATPNPNAIPITTTPYIIPKPDQDVTYYPFKKPMILGEYNASASFMYWPDDERAIMWLVKDPINFQKFYALDCEKKIDGSITEEMNYVRIGEQVVAIIHHKTGMTPEIHYPIHDQLGSITHIMDNVGNSASLGVEEERSFDAWGRMRDPNTWVSYNVQPSLMFDRGYTGHEHLNVFNIINMNGRLYDPLVGRMFNPDPIIPDYTNSQAYNQYSYVLNNPLKYTDPSGYEPVSIGLTIAAVGVGLVGGASNLYQNWHKVKGNGWAALTYFAVGAGGYATSVFNPGVGAAILTGGNIAADAAYGHLPNIKNTSELLNYGSNLVIDAVGVYSVGKVAKPLANNFDTYFRTVGENVTVPKEIIVNGQKQMSLTAGKTTMAEIQVITKKTSYSVYYGMDGAGKIRYVGITSRNAAVRFKEHLNSGTARSLLDYDVVEGATNLTKTQARVLEQNLINQYGLQKNGGLLFNKVNSISPNKWWLFGIK
jgi:RHS repeat-associated core domain